MPHSDVSVNGSVPGPSAAGGPAARPDLPLPGPGVAHPPGREPPSVLVLTKDEEVNIAACLDTLTFSDDIVVLDSFSKDRTCEIAARYPNVRIIQRKFDTWSKHSNWALENITFKHPWVYYSDADERVTPELRDEIIAKTNDVSLPYAAYRVRYKNMFMGTWIKHGGLYPVWIIRLFRPDRIRYEDREVNAHPVVQGQLGDLLEHFIHYSFNKGLTPWFTKHNSYSTMEANEAVRVLKGSPLEKFRQMRDPSASPGVKRRAVKDLSFFVPFRAFVRFLYMYFFRGGFRDGRAGLHYAAMISMYEYWIEIKIRERQRAWRQETDGAVARALGEGPGEPPPMIDADSKSDAEVPGAIPSGKGA
ncbi:MAG: glycosyltransferase family 2 protein [Planctomycetota bacterium]|nr:glycosyltransferase family 2 protein [Planctomycetota bacterium]